MGCSTHLFSMGAIGLGVPLFLVVVFFMVRFLPDYAINIPNREYWLSPERRAETCADLMGRILWLGSLIVCQVAGIHYLIIQANTGKEHLSVIPTLMLMGTFLGAVAVWIISLLRHFSKATG
jgi:hypothetical protein